MRYQQYLRQRYRTLLGYMGGIWIIVALTILAPLLLLPFYPDEMSYAYAFLLAGLPLGVLGGVIRWRVHVEERESPTEKEGMVTLVVSWVVAIVISTVPLMLIMDLTFSQALFEATSGWTTTGLSVVDVTQAPKLILFYRSVMQLIGGAGFTIIVLSALVGPVGSGLSTAEGREDQLAPNVRASSVLVIRMYAAYIVVGIVGLYLTGMTPFDAINHAMAAISTGGFSTRPESIGYWDSAALELVTIVLMLLGTMNFMTAYLLVEGKWRVFLKNGELRLLAVLLPLGALLLWLGTTTTAYADLARQVRVALFEATSAISTTGFATVSYLEWNAFGWMLMILFMLIGGGSGSTAGGIKQFRIFVLLRALLFEIRRAFLPEHAVNEATYWRGDQRSILTDKQVRRIALFVFLYMSLFFMGVLVMLAHGYALDESMFEMASTFGTVGLSVGVTAPDAPQTLLWLQSFAMLLGRLEFFALVIGSIKFGKDLYDMFPSAERTNA